MVVFCKTSESEPWFGVAPRIPFQYPELGAHDADGLTPMKTGLAVVPRECISP